MGLPGAGKTRFAKALSEKMHAVHISSDSIRFEKLKVRSYSDKEKEIVYHLMIERAIQVLKSDQSVVLDATFSSDELRNKVSGHFERYATYFIQITAKESEIKDRLRKSRSSSEADFGVYNQIKNQWDPMDMRHLTLESGDLDLMTTEALKYLGHE